MATAKSAPRHAALGLESERLLAMYRQMVSARAVDRRLWVLSRRRHLAAGLGSERREAVEVGVAAALRPGHDWLLAEAGSVAFWIALGVRPRDVLEAALEPDGWTLGDAAARIVSTSGLVATQVVHAAGIAYAAKWRGLDEVTVVGISGAGTAKGDWHEGLNFAGVHRLALVCLVEAAADDAGVPRRLHAAQDDIARRAEGYGIAATVVDGGDALAACDAMLRAVDRARGGDGPTLLVAQVPRLSSLSARGFRPQEELEALSRRDPIERFRGYLVEEGLLGDAEDERIQQEAMAEVGG